MLILSIKRLPLIAASLLFVLVSIPARSQTPESPVMNFASQVANTCLSHWDTAQCLGVVSGSNMVLLSNYGAALQEHGKNEEAEQLKQHCAATTAASQQSVPAYAMHSALVECANTITAVAEKTGVQPDTSHYQLLIAPLLCLGGDPRCGPIEEQMKAYRTH